MSRRAIPREAARCGSRISLHEARIFFDGDLSTEDMRRLVSEKRLKKLGAEPDDLLLNLQEASYLLTLDRATGRDLVRSGVLPARWEPIDGEYLWRIRLGDVRKLRSVQ